MAHNVITTRN